MDEAEIQRNIEEKQKYLREEIMNKNYDMEEFSEFMNQYKENGLDIANWTLAELKEAVSKFINKRQDQSIEEEENIEKGVENIRNSFNLNSIVYPDLNTMKNTDNNINNNIRINYNYDVINYNNLQNYNNNNNNNKINDNKDIKELNKYSQNNRNNNETKNLGDSSILNPDIDINKEEGNNNINNNKSSEIDNKGREYAEFEIYDESNINNVMKDLIQCVKQSENSLTKNNNLLVTLES